ncbi:MAG: hypothetical protein WC791_00005 [Candidatus Paceibacterota bacterium]|jgi:hypothetical protein
MQYVAYFLGICAFAGLMYASVSYAFCLSASSAEPTVYPTEWKKYFVFNLVVGIDKDGKEIVSRFRFAERRWVTQHIEEFRVPNAVETRKYERIMTYGC